MYFQRLSRDGKRGVIIPKRPAPRAVTIWPKGLLPSERYIVSHQEVSTSETRTGAELMRKGLTFDKMLPGDLIYLNLPMHPGSRLDTEAPKAPSHLAKRRGENMGYPGVEVEWTPGTDNNWVSYYEVFRNGILIDKVAKGTYYFDHSVGADRAATYAVRTVDGASNVSPKISARDPAPTLALIVDDAPGSAIHYSSQWTHGQDTSAYHGTITSSDQKGATAELTFEGKRVLWFTKLGAVNGTAAVSLDNEPSQIVDTYSADDIWGVAVYRKEFPTVGRHTLRISVTGERTVHPADQSKGTFVYLDGIRVEPV